ncbi:unnamed protein product [Pleuronectes platessa]|uniref:Nse4/EID protein Nse3/MAGE-binding domain-containing protein n=1 Tax=Pleuronectes platessa TaxID=8262 RepID=A0A9N7YVU8_PLEPL|nr:unnamed protein product [Pleuronectes platessa]
MRRARGGTTDHAAGPAGCRRKVGRPRSERGVSDSIDLQDKDLAPRRKVQSRFRDLINNLQPPHLREMAPDAQLPLVATDLGKEKASQMSAGCIAFDPIAMSMHLLSFMDLHRLEDKENWGTAQCHLNTDGWHTLARRAECCFKTAPTFHYMRGLFLAELPPPKQQRLWQTKASTKEAKKLIPTQEGFTRIYVDDEMPCIAPVEEGEGKAEAGGSMRLDSVWEQAEEITEASSPKDRQGETDGFTGGEVATSAGERSCGEQGTGVEEGRICGEGKLMSEAKHSTPTLSDLRTDIQVLLPL